VIGAILAAFGAVFLAELPDKTMFATLVLTTRFRRPLAVWVGATAAFAGHVLLAVTVGSFLQRLPDRPVQIGVGLLFLVGAFLLWRDSGDHEHEVDADVDESPTSLSFGRIALRCAAVLGAAEFGDLTQLATAGIAGSTGEPVGVAIGALGALASVAALAVLAGRWIESQVPLHVVRRVAAVVFAGFGIVAIVLAVT
jgi:putative Ca2+/H+ antiporter (TMEM165/GDT1 family)